MSKSILTVDVKVSELDEFKRLADVSGDMYRALREATGWLEEICDCMEEAEMLERCKAALAKADGEQQ